MKLPHKKTTEALTPNWHPDFRDASVLPDLKVVRTSFVVNALCITIASAALLLTAYREYTALNLGAEIRDAESAMETVKARNTELLNLNREFGETTRRFGEAEKFIEAKFAASDLLAALSQSLPGNMDFTTISYDNEVLSLRGTIRGASETASTRVSSYLDVLREDPLVGALFPDVSLTSLLRDPRTQGLSFEIVLKTTSAKPAPKGSRS